MDKTLYSISKALMDVAANARVVLHQSPAAREALKGKDLGVSQRRLLERIDGVKSLEQLFAASADIIGVHAVLGNLLTSGYVSTEASADAQTSAIANVPAATVPPAPEKSKVPGEDAKAAIPARPAADNTIAAAKDTPAPTVVAAAESAPEPNFVVDFNAMRAPTPAATKEVVNDEGKVAGAKIQDKPSEVAKHDAATVEGTKADVAQAPPVPAGASAAPHAPTPVVPASVAKAAELPAVEKAVPAAIPQVKGTPPASTAATFSPTKGAKDEVDAARKLLTFEARHLLGADAGRLQPRIDACRNIEDIYDLIVKFQQHLVKTGKGDPDIFLDRLTKGLELARKEMHNESRSAA